MSRCLFSWRQLVVAEIIYSKLQAARALLLLTDRVHTIGMVRRPSVDSTDNEAVN